MKKEYIVEITTEEVWKIIELTSNNKYCVSNFGRIKNIKTGLLLKNSISRKGYLRISLMSSNNPRKKGTFQVHRLIALAFIENPNNLEQVNHKDGIKDNNHVSNLEWITNADNMKHSWSTGLRDDIDYSKFPKGVDSCFSKFTEEDIAKVRDSYGTYDQPTLAKMYEVNQSTISRILNRKTYKEAV